MHVFVVKEHITGGKEYYLNINDASIQMNFINNNCLA